MPRRFLFRALIPAATLTLTGAIGLTPSTASTATWQIALVTGDPTLQSQFVSVAASSPENAWVSGSACSDIFCTTQPATAEHWNGQAWQPVALPANLMRGGAGPSVATSSANNTWIIADDANGTGYAVHITSSGMTEDTLPNGEQFTPVGAATFSSSDAWAFGTTQDLSTFEPIPYAAHYDGQGWTQVPMPVQPLDPQSISALSTDNIWILGQTFNPTTFEQVFYAARWNGSDWTTVPLPTPSDLNLPAGVLLAPAGILALNSHDVTVTADLNQCPPCGIGSGAVLLHWNGNGWHSMDVPATVGEFDSDMASDGQGGFWVSGFDSGFVGPNLYHFSNDRWTSSLAPTLAGDQPSFSALAWIPGTASLWAAAGLNNTTTFSAQAAIYSYSG